MALFIESHLLVKEEIHIDFNSGRVEKVESSLTTVKIGEDVRPVEQQDLIELKLLLAEKLRRAEKLGHLGQKYKEEFTLLFGCVHCLNAQEASYEILNK